MATKDWIWEFKSEFDGVIYGIKFNYDRTINLAYNHDRQYMIPPIYDTILIPKLTSPFATGYKIRWSDVSKRQFVFSWLLLS